MGAVGNAIIYIINEGWTATRPVSSITLVEHEIKQCNSDGNTNEENNLQLRELNRITIISFTSFYNYFSNST